MRKQLRAEICTLCCLHGFTPSHRLFGELKKRRKIITALPRVSFPSFYTIKQPKRFSLICYIYYHPAHRLISDLLLLVSIS